MSERHLDDEQLNALLDGESDDRTHLATCPACSARLEALTRARDAVAGAVVPPLPDVLLDELVGIALDASPTTDPAIVPLSRSRRLRTPPPAWLIGVAAALLALVGVAGAVRAVTSSSDRGSLALTSDAGRDADDERQVVEGKAVSGGGSAAEAGTTAASRYNVADPEAVAFDLAEQRDPAELGVLLRDVGTAGRLSAADATSGAAEAERSAVTTSAPAAPNAAAPVDRTQCRAQAEQAGGEALGPLLATGRVKWRGQTAEVLVFLLRSPSEGVTRQAMVLQRPGCALLAEQRF